MCVEFFWVRDQSVMEGEVRGLVFRSQDISAVARRTGK